MQLLKFEKVCLMMAATGVGRNVESGHTAVERVVGRGDAQMHYSSPADACGIAAPCACLLLCVRAPRMHARA